MKSMLMFDKIDLVQQHLSSVEGGEGIFILDCKGNIVFANKRAKKIYKIKNEVKKLLMKERINFRKDNKEITIYPVFEEKEIKFFFGIIRDLEEIIKMQNYVNMAHQHVKNFRENIAHYFFNPIVIAKGYLDLLSEKNVEDRDKIEKIRTAIERIEAVVKNIVINGKIAE
ncbi:MAG TPA: hypothetical protein ENI33_00295 [Thermoplasmatales archaeon]|nr:hypothetical protein [Thermoplasmatales archaeon]